MLDGSPFGGDLVATFARWVVEDKDCAKVNVRLIDLYFSKSSIDSAEAQEVFNRALGITGCSIFDIKAVMVDFISVNISGYYTLKQDFGLKFFLLLCMSHLFNNVGDLLVFLLCDRRIAGLIKMFTNS